MKEHDELMKALVDKNIIKSIKLTIAVVPLPKDCENPKEKVDESVKDMLNHTFKTDDDLADKFAAYAVNLALDALVDEFDIQPPEKRAKNGLEALAMVLDEILK